MRTRNACITTLALLAACDDAEDMNTDSAADCTSAACTGSSSDGGDAGGDDGESSESDDPADSPRPGVDDIEASPAEPSAIEGCDWGAATWVRFADFNADGRLDVMSPEDGVVHAYAATGSSFTYFNDVVTNLWGSSAYTWAADVTGDGRADLVSASGGNVRIKRSNGADFVSTTWLVPNAWGAAGFTFTGDFNRDGRADIASAASGVVHVHTSSGSSFTSNVSGLVISVILDRDRSGVWLKA